MISWTDVNKFQKKKLELQADLDLLLKSNNPTLEEINSLRAEIKYLDKQIEKILGTKELERIEESKKKKSGIEEFNKKNYYALRDKYKKMNRMKIATARMLSLIEKYKKESFNQKEELENTEQKSYSKIKV